MPNKKMRLGDILIEAGIITFEQLENALVLQKQKNKKQNKGTPSAPGRSRQKIGGAIPLPGKA